MQFRVPQNISLEDRIIGPFTTIQFFILMIGGGVSYLFLLLLPAPLNEIVGSVLGLLTFTLAVGKFNDQPLYNFIKHIIYFVQRPRTRIWHKAGHEQNLISQTKVTADKQVARPQKKVSRADIVRLATVLDSRGNQGVTPSFKDTPHE